MNEFSDRLQASLRTQTHQNQHIPMSTLYLKGWKPGLKTVSLIQAIKQYSTGSLATAKALAERLLDGEAIELKFQNDQDRSKFRVLATELGAVCSEAV